MSYKRFIKKEGKVYGPYTYESKRINGKIVSKYVEKNKINKKIILGLLAIILVSFLAFLIISEKNSTGKVILQISPASSGEKLDGKLKIILKEGELLPKETLVKISLNEQETTLPIYDLISQDDISGEYYAEGADLTGSGKGYGFPGKKTIYPEVYFTLLVSDAEDSQNPAQENDEISDNESTISKEINQSESDSELNSDSLLEEENLPEDFEAGQSPESASAEENQEVSENAEIPAPEAAAETSSSEPDSGSFSDDSAPITGEAVKGKEKSGLFTGLFQRLLGNWLSGRAIDTSFYEIQGSASFTKDFKYILDGKNAQIKPESVYSDYGNVSEDSLNLEINGDTLFVKSSFSIEDFGFGEDYVSDKTDTLEISLNEFNIFAADGTISIDLIYENKSLAYSEKEIVIAVLNETENETLIANLTNLSFSIIKNIDNLKIQKNSNYSLNAGDYFSMADYYYIENLENINFSFFGDELIIMPKENFTGEELANLTAFYANESLSQQFLISVTDSNLTVETKKYSIILNRPVKWHKKISGNLSELEIEIPKEAENVSFKTGEQAFEAENNAEEEKETIESNKSLLFTGQVILKQDTGVLTRFLDWLSSLKLTGKVIEDIEIIETEENKVVELNLSENESELLIEYFTDAPIANETDIANGKRIIVNAPDELNYTDILAYTLVDGMNIPINSTEKLKLFWYADYNDALSYGYIQENQDLNETADLSSITGNVIIEPELEIETDFESLPLEKQVEKLLDVNASSNLESLGKIKIEIDYDAYDLDGDGYVDYIEWIVPHLSAQTYQIVISTQGYSGSIVKDGNYYHLPVSTSAPYDSLVAYWNFDSDNSSTAFDMTGANNDGSYKNGAYSNSSCVSVYGNGACFDGSNDLVNITGNTPLNISGAFSYGAWVKANYVTTYGGALNKFQNIGGTYHGYNIYFSNATANNGIICRIGLGNANVVDTKAPPPIAGQWYHVMCVYNGTHIKIYVNGSLKDTDPGVISQATTQNMLFGAHYVTGALPFNGSIDEVMVFNTSLTLEQIQAIYNNQSARFQTSAGLNLNQKNITSGYDKINLTNIFTNNMNTNISLALGYYNGSWQSTSAQNISASNIYDISSATTNITLNYTLLSDSYGFYTPFLNDSIVSLTSLDSIAPVVSIIYPLNNSLFNSASIALNYSVSDSDAGKVCWYNNNSGSNTTIADCANTTISLSEGANLITLYANDTSGNVNSTSVTVNLDSANPSQTIISPIAGYNSSSSTVLVNVSASDSAGNISTFLNFDNSLVSWWRMDDKNSTHVFDYLGRNNGTITNAVQTDAGIIGKAFSFDGSEDYLSNSVSAPNGNMTLCAWINPSSANNNAIAGWGNGYNSVAYDRLLYIDALGKAEFYVWPNSPQYVSSTTTIQTGRWYHICGTISTSSGTKIWVNGANESTNPLSTGAFNGYTTPQLVIGGKFTMTVSNDFNGSIDDVMVFNRTLSSAEIAALYANTSSKYLVNSFAGLSEGSHSFTAYTQDNAGNLVSSAQSFTVDSSAPQWSPIPSNQAVNYRQAFSYQINASDSGLGISSYSINDSRFSVNSTGYIINATSLSAGIYWLNASVNDTLGNVNSSVFSVTVNKIASMTSLTFDKSSPQTYGTEITPTCSVAEGVGSASLTRNQTSITSGQPATLAANYYIFNCSLAESENYTYSENISGFTINKASLSASITNTTLLTRTYDGEPTEIGISESNSGDGDVTYKIYANNADYGSSYSQAGAGTYLIVLNSTGGENYSASSSLDSETLLINKATPALSVSGTTPITYPESSDVSGSGCPSQLTCAFDKSNGIYGAGTVTFNYSTPGNANYTSNWTTKTITINQNAGSCDVLFNETSPLIFPGSFTVYSNCNPVFSLYRNGTLVSNNSVQPLAAGNYNFSVFRADTQNYSNNYDDEDFLINKKASACSISGNNVTYPSEVNVSASCTNPEASFFIFRNNSEITSENNQNISLSSNTYYYIANVSETQNYTSAQNSTYIKVTKGTGRIYTYINNSRANLTLIQITDIWLNSTLESGLGDIYLYNNGTLINSGESPLENLTTFNSLGRYNISSVYPGNENYTSGSETFWVNVTDLAPPRISILNPANGSRFSVNNTYVNYSVEDENLESCWWNLNDGVNASIECNTNITSEWEEGYSTIKVFANDSFGFSNYSRTTFYVDTIAPGITINSPLSQNYTSTTIEFNVNTSEASTCRYSLNSGNNVSMPTTDSLNFEKTNSSMIVGNHQIVFYCNDSLGNMNSTSVIFGVATQAEDETPVSVVPSGGGGGGSVVTPSIPEAEVQIDSNEFNIDLAFNTDRQKSINVKNIGADKGTVKLRQENLDNIVTFSETSFELNPGEEKEIGIAFHVGETPGIYTGKIFVNEQEILVSVNVKSKILLFDAMISVPEENKKISPNEKLDTQITLIPMGEDPRLDVTLNYVIKDFTGKTYLTESETILVTGQKSFKKSFNTDKLPPGDYAVGLELVYPNGVATSSSSFEVVESWPINFKIVLLGLLGGIFIAILSIVIISIRYKKHKNLLLKRR